MMNAMHDDASLLAPQQVPSLCGHLVVFSPYCFYAFLRHVCADAPVGSSISLNLTLLYGRGVGFIYIVG